MSDDAEQTGQTTKKGKGPLIGLVLMLVLGGGSFFVVYSGLVNLPFGAEEAPAQVAGAPSATPAQGDSRPRAEPAPKTGEPLPAAAFLPLDPVLVTIGRGDGLRQLQVTAQLEVESGMEEQAGLLAPRARDALTSYLRAVRPEDVEEPSAMLRMRAQMLRRIQVVMGEGLVRDLLISDFILR